MDISIDTQKAIINQELEGYLNSRYLLQLRHRVNKSIGADSETLSAIEAELVKTEQAIEILKKELKAGLT